MNYILSSFLLLAFVQTCICQDYLRFINGIEGMTVTINTDKLSSITLNYQQISEYQPVTDGRVTVNSVVDGNSTQLFNVAIGIEFKSYATVAVVQTDSRFYLVLFNESMPVVTSIANKTFIRLIDLGSTVRYISLNANSQMLFSFVGFLEATPYISISSSTAANFIVSQSDAATTTFPVTSSITSLTEGRAYTVFFFTPASGSVGILVNDREVTPVVIATTGELTTGMEPSTTGNNEPSTTGLNEPVVATTGFTDVELTTSMTEEVATTNTPVIPSTSTSSTSNNNINNGNADNAASGLNCYFAVTFSLIGALFLF